ncbi:MAG: ABC transporter permease [Candidatus Paceibacterota bacterium]|jgi:putative ABC transport system permease protein|nr:ABC transporter permease [Candidatus Paceibacterota bacterium]MDD5555108.1 ABC transporter permease [Candidatus Paceibacterota bacterium]
MSNYFQIAFESLKKQKGRAVLTMIAVAIGIASLIVMLASGDSLKQLILGEIDMYGSDVVNVEVRVPGRGTAGSGTDMATGISVTTFKNSDVEAISKMKNISAYYAYITSQEVIKYQGENMTCIVFGYGAQAPLVEKINIAEGRFYTTDEEDSLSSVIVLGSKVKENLFGDNEAVGQNVYVRGKPFRVVGVLEKRGQVFFFDMDSIVYLPVKTIQKKLLGTDYVLGVSVKARDPNKLDQIKEELVALMRERHDIDDPGRDDFEVMTMVEAKEMTEVITNSITLLLAALAAISLVVGGVGITNIMYVSVVERTFEIGVRRSIGAKKKDILFQFLTEAVLLTFSGGVLGVVMAIGLTSLIYAVANSYGLSWPFSISLGAVFYSILFSIAVGLFFGVYPAQKAANINPIEALRKD